MNGDVVERAKDSLNVLEHCRAAGVTPDGYPERLVRDLVSEVEKLRRAAKTLGKIIDDSLTDVLKATDSYDLIGEDGDGDWMVVFERLMELRPARDAAMAAVGRVRELHQPVTDITDETVCTGCGAYYGDCPTLAALDGDPL